MTNRSADMRVRPERIGIFGGTFDPVHLGHLIAAREAAERLRLDRVLLVPAGRPPHKCRRRLAPAAQRARMVRRAVAGDPLLRFSGVELASRCASYTVDTLRSIGRRHPRARLFLLVGLDQAALLHTWKDPGTLFALATVCALARPGFSFAAIPPRWRRRIVPVPVSAVGISASAIRARLRRGLTIRNLVPPAVERYIAAEGLYSP
ncbi:MAG: nicotinate-nucleotide adenylyltransferase [Candidatus Edwardsbacteria bacterium]|nr:nicotinate-nucleotide adenylyltransferase [Candidatus Edwardsbacteria bacterium]